MGICASSSPPKYVFRVIDDDPMIPGQGSEAQALFDELGLLEGEVNRLFSLFNKIDKASPEMTELKRFQEISIDPA